MATFDFRIVRYNPPGLAFQKELKDLINAELEDANCLKSCLSCVRFDEPSEICKAAGKRPPAAIIAFGCEQYVIAPDSE